MDCFLWHKLFINIHDCARILFFHMLMYHIGNDSPISWNFEIKILARWIKAWIKMPETTIRIFLYLNPLIIVMFCKCFALGVKSFVFRHKSDFASIANKYHIWPLNLKVFWLLLAFFVGKHAMRMRKLYQKPLRRLDILSVSINLASYFKIFYIENFSSISYKISFIILS